MILGSFGYLLFLVVHANYNMCEAGVGAQRSGDHFEGNENTLEYNKPWTRCGPFLLGVLLACYQSQHSNRAGHIPAPSTLAIILGYLLSLAVMAVYVFSPWWARNHHGLDGGNWMDGTCEWSRGWDAFYIITRRTAWGGAVTYLIYAALVCKGGPITRFLSWNFWTPFARLTYGWYLCHPLWMSIIFRSNGGMFDSVSTCLHRFWSWLRPPESAPDRGGICCRAHRSRRGRDGGRHLPPSLSPSSPEP
jgi:hypothetical protein